MNYYEGVYIIDPTLADEKIIETTDSITSELSQKGEILAIEKTGKRPLAYSVKKMTEGYYMTVYFTCDPAEIPLLHKRYGLNPSLIRVMILRRKEEEIQKMKEKIKSKPELKEETTVSISQGKPDWNEPVDDWKETENFIQLPDENSEESDENPEEL